MKRRLIFWPFILMVVMVHNKSPPLTLNKFSFTSKLKFWTFLENLPKRINSMPCFLNRCRPLLFKLIIIPHRSEFNYHSVENGINYWFDKLEVFQGRFIFFGGNFAAENTSYFLQNKYAVGKDPLRALHLSWGKQTENKEHRSHFISLASKKLKMHFYKIH